MFSTSQTEMTTAATDALLAALCAGIARSFVGLRAGDGARAHVWTWVYGLVAFGAALGTLAHGLALSDAARWTIWQPLYLSLGLTVALFVTGALYDWRGPAVARRVRPFALGAGATFYVVTLVSDGSFALFLVYEGVAMIGALVIYLMLAATRRVRGAAVVAGGIALSLVAAAVQASPASITLVWTFDHNGLFHLVQMVAVLVLAQGLRQGMTVPRAT